MQRRTFLTGSAVAAGGLLAGCAEVTGGLEVTSTDAQATAFGNVEIAAQVENHGSDSQTGTLVGEVDLQDGTTHTEQTSITVPGERSDSYSVTVDLPISDSLSGSRYQYDAWID